MSGSTDGALVKTPTNQWFYSTDVFWTGALSNVALGAAGIAAFIVKLFAECPSISSYWFCMPRSDGDLTEALVLKEIAPYGGTLDDVHNGRVIVASVAQRTPIFQRPDVQARCAVLLPQDDGIFNDGLEVSMRDTHGLQILPWNQRRPIVFWRGSCSADYKNNELLRRDVVASLAAHPSCDVKLLKHWHEGKDIPESYFGAYLPLQHFLGYKFLLILDGNGISSSHSWVFGSGAVPLLVTNCDFWFRPHLVPYENYVPIRYDLGDLIETIDWLLAHDDDAERIAQGALAFSKTVFTPAFQQNYLRTKLLGLEHIPLK